MTAKQTPISSGFGASSTAEDIIKGIDLSGKIVIVTGGFSGRGLKTARVLSSAGAKVIVPTRDRNKAATALADIDGIEIEEMDLLDPTSIDALQRSFLPPASRCTSW